MYFIERDHTEFTIYGNGQELATVEVQLEEWTQTLLNAMFFYRTAFEREFGVHTVDLEEALYNSVVHHWLSLELGTDYEEDREDVWDEMVDNYGSIYEYDDDEYEKIQEEFRRVIRGIDFSSLGIEEQKERITADLEKLWLENYDSVLVVQHSYLGEGGDSKYAHLAMGYCLPNRHGGQKSKWCYVRAFLKKVAEALNSEIFWDIRKEEYEV